MFRARATIVLASIAAATLLGGTSRAQTEAAPAVAQGQPFVLDAGQHTLKDLIERSARFLGRNYTYQESDFAGNPNTVVKTQRKLELDRAGCEEVVGQLLYSKGFAVVPLDPERGLYEVINMQGPKRAELHKAAVEMTPEQVFDNRRKKVVVRCALRLTGLDSQVVMTQLRPMVAQAAGASGGLVVGTLGSGRDVVLQGFADEVASTIETIRRIDVPDEHAVEQDKQIEARVARLEKQVAELAKQLAGLRERIGR